MHRSATARTENVRARATQAYTCPEGHRRPSDARDRGRNHRCQRPTHTMQRMVEATHRPPSPSNKEDPGAADHVGEPAFARAPRTAESLTGCTPFGTEGAGASVSGSSGRSQAQSGASLGSPRTRRGDGADGGGGGLAATASDKAPKRPDNWALCSSPSLSHAWRKPPSFSPSLPSHLWPGAAGTSPKGSGVVDAEAPNAWEPPNSELKLSSSKIRSQQDATSRPDGVRPMPVPPCAPSRMAALFSCATNPFTMLRTWSLRDTFTSPRRMARS
mmetsp:Transcript_74272/g.205768  ORF Transcript_74272/g.205768 Transcript_74272/m.205768 type:complete len:273 (+) Transcript_74272:221-1039(+)